MYSNNSFSDEFLSSSVPSPNGLAIPTGLNDDDFPMNVCLNDDTNHSNGFAGDPSEFEGINDLSHPQYQLFDMDPSDLIDSLLALLPNNSTQNNSPPVEAKPKKSSIVKSFIVKSCEAKHLANFIHADRLIVTGKSLQLTTPPFPHQRSRYERELIKTLRYIFVPDDGSITLTVSDHPSNIEPQMEAFVRITRTTKPYGPGKLMICHPYPIWLNDKDGKVHNGSLIIPFKGVTIQIPKLVIQRSLQKELNKIKKLAIFSSDELNFNTFFLTNGMDAKELIDQFQLRYYILHFQVIFVDQDNKAYLTDLKCQTEPNYEHDSEEFKTFSADIRAITGKSIKRKRIGKPKKSATDVKTKKIPKKSVDA